MNPNYIDHESQEVAFDKQDEVVLELTDLLVSPYETSIGLIDWKEYFYHVQKLYPHQSVWLNIDKLSRKTIAHLCLWLGYEHANNKHLSISVEYY